MPQAEEHRAHVRLQRYWDSLKGSQPYPGEHQFDSTAIADIWPSCFLISIDAVTHRLGYRYSYLGDDLIEAFGDDSGNLDVALTLLSTIDTPIVKLFDEVRHSGKPVAVESEFINMKGFRIKYRASFLPLGPRPGEVSHIIGCMRWKMC